MNQKSSWAASGHKNPELPDDLSALAFTEKYLSAYDDLLASSGSAEEFRTKVNKMFPGLGLEVILNLASDAVFPKGKKAA